MKNIFPLIVVTLLLVMFLVGCTDAEEKENNHGGGVYHSGTWELKDISGENPIIVLKQGE